MLGTRDAVYTRIAKNCCEDTSAVLVVQDLAGYRQLHLEGGGGGGDVASGSIPLHASWN